jgi:hypothetical protein
VLGTGTVTIDEFFNPRSIGRREHAAVGADHRHPARGRAGERRQGGRHTSVRGGQTIAGTATSRRHLRHKHATGSYTVTGTQAAAGGATILTLHGSTSY